MKVIYGRQWLDEAHPLTVEMTAFRYGWGPETGALGKYQHFLNILRLLWPYDSKKYKQGVQFNPWSEIIWEELCRWQYLGISGPKSSAKTESLALWGLVNWWCAPHDTLVLMTSTSLKDARRRIWGSVRERFIQAQSVAELPGKLVDSMGIIRLDDATASSDKSSISLIPSSPEKEKEATAKLIGLKQKRVFLIGDELTDISHSVVEACHNLDANENFQFVALGNYKSDYDPFGVFVTPKAGWNSVSVEDDRWLTQRGMCLHLDGMKTPNAYSDPVDKWPFLYRKRDLDATLERGEENTIQFWRFIRSFPAPSGADAAIYTEADLRKFKAGESPIWEAAPRGCAGCDPGFTNEGDRSILYFLLYGRANNGKQTVCFHDYVELKENVTDPEPRTFQIARQIIDHCQKRNIAARFLEVDATGAGDPFCDVLDGMWGARVTRVKFSEKPTETQAGVDNPQPASAVYANRATELWYSGVEFLRSDQFRGIGPELAREITARLYTTGQRGKLKIEPKREMKARMGRSPDLADAAFLGLDAIRQQFGASAGGIGDRLPRVQSWNRFVKRLDVFDPTHLEIQSRLD